MNSSVILNQILSLAVTLFPTSYILIMHFARTLSKKLYSLGETTAICTSITGILSKKNPVVSVLHFDEFQFQINDNTPINKELITTSPSIEIISAIISYCHFPKQKILEESIQNFLKNYNKNPQDIKDSYRMITEIPCDNEKKLTTAVVIKKNSEDVFSFSKGNVKTILDKCTKIIIDNKKINLTPDKKRAIKRRIEKLSKQGRKLIGFAYKGLPKKILETYTEEFTENDLTFVGFIGLNDEINTHLKDDIEKVRQSNIKIYITSSLKEKKARHAAFELKLVNTSYFETLNGATIADMDDKKLQKIISNRDKDFIFCELTSTDKQRIIKQLENNGEKVTTLNPNEGINFKQVLESVKNLKEKSQNDNKIKIHSINCKIAEAIIIITAIIFGNPTPLSLIMIVMVDVIVNIILELAIRENRKTEDSPPKSHISSGIFMGIALATIYILNLMRFGWTPGYNLNIGADAFAKSATIIVSTIIIFQIIAAYIEIKKPFKNIYLLLSTIVCILFIYSLNTISSLQTLFDLGPLGTIEWQIIAFTVVLLLTFEETRKYINRHKKNANTSS